MSDSVQPPRTEGTAEIRAQSPACCFPVLLIFELACRVSRAEPLCLSGTSQEVKALQEHLAEGCATCSRWYNNALQAMESTLRETVKPAARIPRMLDSLAAADDGCDRLQHLPPEEGARGMEALPFLLEWWKDPNSVPVATGEQRWWITLKCRAASQDHGGVERSLRSFAGCRVQMKYWLARQRGCRRLRTRLDLDAHGNLVSPPESVLVADPGEVVRVKLTARHKRAQELDCT